MSIVNWVRVSRVQTAGVTVMAVLLGAITVRSPTVFEASMLIATGLFVHVWGFSQNEVMDSEFDRPHNNLEVHPIARGEISKKKATIFSYASIAIAGVFFGQIAGVVATITLGISTLFGFLYNKTSKDKYYSGVFLSLWSGLLTLSGALALGSLNIWTIVFAIAISLHAITHIIEGDIKDITGPEQTLIGEFGAYMKLVEPKVSYPKDLKAIIYGLDLFYGLLLFVPLYFRTNGIPQYASALLFLIGANIILVMLALMRNVLHANFERDSLKQLFSAHEILSVALISLSALLFDIWVAAGIVIFVPVWYIGVNKLIYSEALNPSI